MPDPTFRPRVMCVGDSITESDAGDNRYRNELLERAISIPEPAVGDVRMWGPYPVVCIRYEPDEELPIHAVMVAEFIPGTWVRAVNAFTRKQWARMPAVPDSGFRHSVESR